MCVIFVMQDKRLEPSQVSDAFAANSAGGGVAWRDMVGNETPVVRWRKGLSLEEMHKACATLPIPYIAHFRIPSTGGDGMTLCHPFPVTPEVEEKLEGETPDYVLFHNGTWVPWKHELKQILLAKGVKLPPGNWSDTRALALYAYHFGVNILDIMDEKAATLSPTDLQLYASGWSFLKESGIWASNRGWETKGSFKSLKPYIKPSDTIDGDHYWGDCGMGGRTSDYYHGQVPASLRPKGEGLKALPPIGGTGENPHPFTLVEVMGWRNHQMITREEFVTLRAGLKGKERELGAEKQA